MKHYLRENWRGYAVLKISKKYNFQADVLDKIIDGNNNPTTGTGSTGLDKKKNLIYHILPILKIEGARKC